MSRAAASRLRKNSTDAERALWAEIRNRRLRDCKFRRQHPLGPYVVDFACISHRLVVEVDGGQHTVRTSHDATRERWFMAHGFRVIRFWNHEVLQNIKGVKQAIAEELSRPILPHPNPLPQSGGEGDT